VVHFYHSDFTDEQSKKILHEQADAWFALNRFMRDQWFSIFGEPLNSKLALDEDGMLRSSFFYADAKFRYLKPELDGLENRDVQSQFAAPVVKKLRLICVYMRKAEIPCMNLTVWSAVPGQISISKLPDCGIKQNLYATGETEFTCVQCNHSSSRYDLLDEWEGKPEDFSHSGLPASCSDCDGYETVCEYGGGYLCTTCLVLHDSLETCGYCGGHSTSVPEMSGLIGCNFCDGNVRLLEE
jgi:hypothetical protein